MNSHIKHIESETLNYFIKNIRFSGIRWQQNISKSWKGSTNVRKSKKKQLEEHVATN